MNRFTIRSKVAPNEKDFMLVGTFSGATEADALDASAVDRGHASFEELCEKTGLTRDDHKVEKVKE